MRKDEKLIKVTFYGHRGGGKVLKPPSNTPDQDTSALPPLRDSHRESPSESHAPPNRGFTRKETTENT